MREREIESKDSTTESMKETTGKGQLTNQKRAARRGGYEYLVATLPNKKFFSRC